MRHMTNMRQVICKTDILNMRRINELYEKWDRYEVNTRHE